MVCESENEWVLVLALACFNYLFICFFILLAMRLTNGAIGVIYGELNRFEQALQVLSLVYSSSVREGDEENTLFSLGWLGKIHQFHDSHESAKGYFSKQLKVSCFSFISSLSFSFFLKLLPSWLSI